MQSNVRNSSPFSTTSADMERTLGRSFSGRSLHKKYPTMVRAFRPSAMEGTRMTGTARYMSPELHELSDDSLVTNKVDIFSFAILAYEILSRSRAYSHMGHFKMDQVYIINSPTLHTHLPTLLCRLLQIVKEVHQNQLRPPLPRKWSSELKAFFQRAWAHDPKERPCFSEITAQLGGMIERRTHGDTSLAKLHGLQEAGELGCNCVIS